MNTYRVSKVTPAGKVVPIAEIGADEYYFSCCSILDKQVTIRFRNFEKGWRGQIKSQTEVATLTFEGNILVEAK